MKLKIELIGTTKEGKEIREIVQSNVTSARGHNKAVESQHKAFWKRHPEIETSRADVISECVYI